MSSRSALFESLLLSPSSSPVPSRIPPFLYGCAWKKERTPNLVYQALSVGFKGIDVAAQPRHYREDLVGDGMRRALKDGKVKRGDLFVQTKFTPPHGQDPKNMPYDPSSSITEQVQQSIKSSLHNLRISDDPQEQESTYIDSLVLHSPYPSLNDTLEAWHAAEAFIPDTIKYLGISNVSSLKILQELYRHANIKPSVIQNRFHRDTDYEKEIRKYCLENDMVFQSFWTLTANPQLLKSKPVLNLASAADVDPAVAMYALVMGLENVVILNGTTSHLEDDIEGLARVKAWAEKKTYDWENSMKHFKDLIGENLIVKPPIRGVE